MTTTQTKTAWTREVATKWTPGPWKVGSIRTTGIAGRAKVNVIVGKKRLIASVGNGGPNGEDRDLHSISANARLISKAPEMAELLRDSLSLQGLNEDDCTPEENEYVERVERLLAEIEGGSHDSE